jgi:hypothetical protein
MHFTLDYILLGAASSLLEVVVCALALRRRLYARLPLFTTYLAILVTHELTLWWFYLGSGYDSRLTFYYFWVTQGILVAARAAAVVEIAWRALRGYRGVWALGWRLLCFFGLILLFHAAMDAHGNASFLIGFIVTAERDLELAVAVVLVALLAFGRYYRIRLDPVQRMVALGLGFYSAVQVLNNGLPRAWQTLYFDWWNAIRMTGFLATLVIWLVALRKSLAEAAPAPTLLPQGVYDELSPQVNYRLRVLNERLLEILKS